MSRSQDKVLKKRDRKIFLQGAELVRNQGYTVSWSLETIEEINDLISKDRFHLYVEPDGLLDVFVILQKDGEEIGRRRVYIVGDEVYTGH